jgi:hypothetical protein
MALRTNKPRLRSRTSTFTMSRAAKSKWLKALRSGRYKQTTDALSDGKGYCCLGVLLRTQGASKAQIVDLGLPRDIAMGAAWGVQSYKVMREGSMVSLAALNDQHLLTFEQIADLIEHQVPCHD